MCQKEKLFQNAFRTYIGVNFSKSAAFDEAKNNLFKPFTFYETSLQPKNKPHFIKNGYYTLL